MAGALGVVLVLGVAAAVVLAREDRVPRGTRVAGVAVGGLDRGELRTALRGPVAGAVARAVRVRVGDNPAAGLDPTAAGVTLDRAATETALLGDGPMNLRERLRSLRHVGRDVEPALAVDEATAKKALGDLVAPFERTARDAKVEVPAPTAQLSAKGDASFTAEAADVQVTPARTGVTVDVPGAVDALAAAVRRGERAITLPQKVTEPGVATAALEKVDQLIGTFTTEHPCCAPRVTNIHRIAELVDGAVIEPGEVFSLNQRAGRRTAANGFVEAPAIADGEFVSQFGGGVSQFSTTLFNAAWFAGLPIPTHQPHSQYISRYPPGREATLDYDTIDQKIRNDTDVPVVIRASATATSVTVGLYGHTGDRTVTSTTGPEIPRSGGGFSVGVRRVVRQGDAGTGSDDISWTYTGIE